MRCRASFAIKRMSIPFYNPYFNRSGFTLRDYLVRGVCVCAFFCNVRYRRVIAIDKRVRRNLDFVSWDCDNLFVSVARARYEMCVAKIFLTNRKRILFRCCGDTRNGDSQADDDFCSLFQERASPAKARSSNRWGYCTSMVSAKRKFYF